MSSATDVTSLLRPDATESLMRLLYGELRALASSYLSAQRPDHTLQPTALVHEAYLRLLGKVDLEWESRTHFFSVAAMAMRQVLVNHAAAKRSLKRGADSERITLCETVAAPTNHEVNLVALDEALGQLEALDERQARIVEMRYFAGLGIDEIAHVLRVSPSTVEKNWRMARLWLLRRLNE